MQNTQIMRIEVNEMPKAFRVNGVTIAKRHLKNTLDGDDATTLAKFLVIVPFLTEVFDITDDLPESVKYGAIKAKRVYQALGLSEEDSGLTVAFMMVALSQAGLEPTIQGLRNFGPVVARGFTGNRIDNVRRLRSFPTGNRENVISFAEARKNRTLH